MTLEKPETRAKLMPGLTWRTFLAIFFASFVFIPISLYLQLTVGAVLGGITFIIAILFNELSRMYGRPINRHELFVIYTSTEAAATTWMVTYVYRAYFVTSPLLRSFSISGVSLEKLIPLWWAPPTTSQAYIIRTIFHPDFLIPIVISTSFGILLVITEMALLMLTTKLYIDAEKLPFPFASITVEMIDTLTVREKSRLSIFAETAVLGAFMGFLIHGLSISLGIQLIPFPWFDLTGISSQFLPGAILGIATEPLTYVTSLLVPWNVAINMIVSSIFCWVFLNWAFLEIWPGIFPKWKQEFLTSMKISTILQRSSIYIWMVPQFLYLFGTIGSVALFHALVPDFPVLIPLILSVGLTFIFGVVGARTIGEAGYGLPINASIIWNGAVYLVNYKGADAWLIQPSIGGAFASSWTQSVKVAYLTRTRPIDFIKAWWLAYIAYHIFGWFWVDFFWKIAPIPSSVYPYSMIQWPVQLLQTGMWMTRQIDFRTEILASSFSLMLIALIIGDIFASKFLMPFSATGLVLGTTTIPPYAFAIFIASTLSRFLFHFQLEKA